MKTSDKTLMEQLRLTARAIARRKKYFGLTEEDSKILRAMKTDVAEALDEIIEEFYKHLLLHDELDQIIGDAETLLRLKNHFRSYLLTIFDGQFDEEYVHSRLRVGVVHRRIGVKPHYYVSAMHRLSTILRRRVLDGSSDANDFFRGSTAIEKVLMFDLSLTVDTYIHSLMDASRRSRAQLAEYAESLEETIAERTRLLNEQARCDSLTGLLNQRTFYRELRKELSRGQRQGYSVLLVYFDIDGFKKINDKRGHRAGDALLEKVADAARKTTRRDELIARYGGDEFCIILPNATMEEGTILAKRLCETTSEMLKEKELSLSVGIAASTPLRYLDAETLVKLADEAMYRAKKRTGYWVETAQCDQTLVNNNNEEENG